MRLSGVGRRYGYGPRGRWVLRDVDLELADGGALVRVEGGNGSGKSTLLRLIAGVDVPTAGTVTGRPATAYVPERFPAELPFTASGYLTRIGRIHGLSGREASRRARHWLARFDVAGHADTPLDRLSKGTCQKVAVAQALLAEPALLVLDEAWTGLDASARRLLDETVLERVAAGGTAVFVDHSPRRAATEATAVYQVAGGRVTALPAPDGGPVATVVRIVAEGDGEPPADLAPHVRGGAREIRLTVPEADCDQALRTLLSADPPWHVRSVTPVAPGDDR
ncbi:MULTISPECIES: ATP-binding cassette domain-containing protein [Streptomycetaceae]|uniref:ABC transporter ATP-binding protein n=1 Tax=Streptantibioticus cattleyicolor (strain ATCC 35852 / DSM 46488 / JCM 4925 / NBRC 14057 / NRRL 8057) TaxID=1003195 RepID=F8JWR3_STREN|nr:MULTISPECIES: ABC transporter ATP-binding protein [Streptomycetaceae]AEW97061.1 ABC transporter ATP-binding protein [Streptantibioticus cattleyicolor NRRL 8057 = DSM 46488]MYS61525.1 ATP-binding cassette domain-containing protein [Streptomyces sp. SID5468]CCB77386.1 ABC-transporter ATP-binding protein [Streptantibioticus cattleyicolor NRRL 8057 = DSM 46488]